MPEWDADFDVDEALARSLIEEQFPRLDASSARLVGSGWDNAVWLVEEKWAFRFPRREIAVPLVARELASSRASLRFFPSPSRFRPSSGKRPRAFPGRSSRTRHCLVSSRRTRVLPRTSA